MLEPGTALDNGKYRIEAAIGRGGFGHVYRARERLTGDLVAIKELVPGLVGEPQMVERFIQEARATKRLTHPNIAHTDSVFQEGGTYYLTMEYLAGGSLSDRLRRGAVPIDESVRIMDGLCAALEYAHGQGVVHCDIKPANVLFDAHGAVHLADFGIAHVSEQLMTRHLHTGTGSVMGTVRYMAPEQLEGVRDDPRLDVYALGALLYEMLAGRPYLDFETETTPAAQMRNMQRIQGESPWPLAEVNPATPPWLAAVVERALRKMPEERYPTVTELRDGLQQRSAAAPEMELAAAVPLRLLLPDGGEQPLAPGSMTLGRDPGNEVVIDGSEVSRRHAVVQVTAGGAQIFDLGSTNGTYLNGEPLVPRQPRPLHAGDSIRLGASTTVGVLSGTVLRPVPVPAPQPVPPAGAPSWTPPAAPTRVAPTTEPPPRSGLAGWQWALLVGILLLFIAGIVGVAVLSFGGGSGEPTAFAGGTSEPDDTPAPVTTGTSLPPVEPSPTLSPTLQPDTPTPTPEPDTPMPTDVPPTDTATPTSSPTPDRDELERELLDTVRWRSKNGPPLFAYYADRPPTLDGFLDTTGEWTGSEYVIDQVVSKPENWQGAADLSARFYLAWDNDHLYLGMAVRDDQHVQLASGSQLYKGDDIEIQIDKQLQNDYDGAALSGDDAQMGMTVRDPWTGDHEAYVWLPSSLEGPLNLSLAAQPAEGGYVLEAAVPWRALSLLPQVETPYGFCLSLGDNDSPGTQDQQSMVSSAPRREWGDPRTWGTLVLVNW